MGFWCLSKGKWPASFCAAVVVVIPSVIGVSFNEENVLPDSKWQCEKLSDLVPPSQLFFHTIYLMGRTVMEEIFCLCTNVHGMSLVSSHIF